MLYVRHGKKSYSNRKSSVYSLDPNLTNDGKKQAHHKFKYLLKKFGCPDLIITSPYLRTRETADIAQFTIFELTDIFVPILYDSAIGEYLGNQKNVSLDTEVRPETLIHNPIPPETWEDFICRVKSHVYKTDNADGDNLYIWYVTHGLVIQKICSTYGVDIPYPSELSGVFINNRQIQVT
jgi:broad specificity phosphatase PhoE